MTDPQSRHDADDAELFRELVEWEGDGFPAALDPIIRRFRNPARPDLYVARGWWPLIIRLNRRLAALAPDYRLVQVKQKFGGLRFYLESTPDGDVGAQFTPLLEEAEAEAYRTCEVCGKPGVLYVSREGGYVRLCPDDAGVKYTPVDDQDDDGGDQP